jgi:MOSC domain-containing protein YiiM
MKGHITAIWVKRMKGSPMDPVTSARLVAGRGIIGNANQGGHRQVTIIEQELWSELMADLGASLPPATRRANLMVADIGLADSSGRVLRVGDCRISILGETRPCEQMEAALPGLRKAMESAWRGGAFGEVLDDGEIKVGDPVRWVE